MEYFFSGLAALLILISLSSCLGGPQSLRYFETNFAAETPSVQASRTHSFQNPTYVVMLEQTKVIPPPTCCPPTKPPLPYATGIFEVHMMPQPYSTIWRGLVHGRRISVYAGGIAGSYSNKPNSTPGALRVDTYSDDLSNRVSTHYKTQELTGWLTITAEDHNVLTLTGQNGQTLYFDVLTMQFVGSPTATRTAPTITPVPPLLPTPFTYPPITRPYPPAYLPYP